MIMIFNQKTIYQNIILFILVFISSSGNSLANTQNLKVTLGKFIFSDTNLSEPQGQACVSCHMFSQAGANTNEIVSHGAAKHLFGNRNSPSIIYSKYTVNWHYNVQDETWMGGFFLDGRALNLFQQAKGPFLNPVEMGNVNIQQLVTKIKQSSYKNIFESVYGQQIWEDDNIVFDSVADALVMYQQSEHFYNRFSSKYDAYLSGIETLSASETRGLKIYEDESKGNCAACHPSKIIDKNTPPLFTDFSYDNLGIPKNPKLPFYTQQKKYNPTGRLYTDVGLGNNPNILVSAAQLGKFKVPTLRNISQTAPYMHNGVFSSLEEVIDFYNTRDVDDKWSKPETVENINKEELGDLKLNENEISDLVDFLETLNDGYIESTLVK